MLHPILKPQCFCDLWTAFFSKLQRLNEETQSGKCVRVCDDGCVVETEGGVEDKQRKKERRKTEICSFTVKSLS